MSGITPIDRRDLERMLKAAVHSEKRDEVEVKVIFCVQYSFLGEPDAVQTLVDPWQPFPRRNGLALSKAAIEALDKRGRTEARQVLAMEAEGGPSQSDSGPIQVEPARIEMEPSNPDNALSGAENRGEPVAGAIPEGEAPALEIPGVV